ncbi:MAG TPA: coagulation factor 5/8 type domain-containing protein [Thermoanaerobaculia bacterium]|nr:coagulation factor 5/8 type domain-containing protein [Thermoanaerobaculia bacterium]
MRAEGRRQKVAVWAVTSAFCLLPFAFSQVIDDFNGSLNWRSHPSDGVSLIVSQEPAGMRASALRMDFDFHGHGGYAIAHKPVSIDLAPDFEFAFWIRGVAPPNNLEFKLVDDSGDNVWWVNQRNYIFPKEWTHVVLKKRHFQFAWGPLGGGEPHHIAAIEIVVTAGTGGKGMVLVDDLTLAERHVAAVDQPLTFTTPTIDFTETREFGGLIVENDAPKYDLQVSNDAETWQTIYSVKGARSPRQFLYTPETEASHIRVVPPARRVTLEPIAWSASRNDFFTNVARESARGDYPRYFQGEQSYWTVVGVDGDTNEALFNVDGALEPEKGGYSLEPFLYTGGRLLSWNDVQPAPALARGFLPMPSVKWPQMTITAYAFGPRQESTLYIDYVLRSPQDTNVTLFVAVRPFQVNPPWQFLGVTGGVSPIHDMRYHNHIVEIDNYQPIIPLTLPAGFGAVRFDEGNIVDWLQQGKVPESAVAIDDQRAASGAFSFPMHLEAGKARTVTIAVPMHDRSKASDGMRPAAFHDWEQKLGRAGVDLPASGQAISDSIRANLAYILIHRDGPSLQPGSRSYERSWIRDGSMISEALLRLGMSGVVKEYIEWYVKFQYPDGKVPCCVDSRGADPVPENDSHGELIYLIAEYYRHTHDRALVERVWLHIVSAVNYIDALRHQRMTAQYKNTPFFGLLPESISHEGYSAKPMHSYWDDFFAAKGLSDATYLAHALGFIRDEKKLTIIRDEFERDLLASIKGAMAVKQIDYIPGSVELGDFDPTSTTIAISPGGQLGKLPAPALARTFDRYFDESRSRAMGIKPWDAYTPYEWRTVGTFVRLGQPQRAYELANFFMRGQRPPEWRQWAEVVWRDPKAPKFIGDMPHGWVASDFLRSVLDMFAYDRDDGALVIGAGVQPEWATQSPGVTVRNLDTHQGVVSFSMRGTNKSIQVTVSGPLSNVIVHAPLPKPKEVRVNGKVVAATQDVGVRTFPSEVVFTY